VVGLRPRAAQAGLDRLAVAFGEMIEDVAFFVLHTALDGDVVAEHLPDGFAQRLGALNAVANFEFERLIDRIRGPLRRNRS
jgi:hypothetical protein